MLKFLFILASLFIVGFFMVHDTWMIGITAFGFEITTSLLTVILALGLMWYVWRLLKKPFCWLGGCRDWLTKRKQTRKEAYLLLALRTVLDQDSQAIRDLLKQKKSFFDSKSDENYILEALFAPSTHAFEQLIHRENTELAGIRGLLSYAEKQGDYEEMARLLVKAAAKHPDEIWIHQARWTVQTHQSDWSDALQTLDILKKKGVLPKADYHFRQSLVLLKLGRVKEAYKLNPDHPAIACAYATAEPKKALSIVMDLWEKSPCDEAYALFKQAIAGEKSAKQMKLTEKLVRHNPTARLSLIALAQTAMDNDLWGLAKEYLTAYINAYPLTARVALMMATLERQGWHHEEGAREWEAKAQTAAPDSGWGCATCGRATESWDALCPHCNAFGTIAYR